MTSSPALHLVVLGVSGAGKTVVGTALAERLDLPFRDGDDLHTDQARAKMSAGEALDDEDRWPWLEALAAWTRERAERGEDTLLTCSALKRSYRDVLRRGGGGTFFVHLTGDHDLLAERMGARQRHFMPSSMLRSQLDTLEPLDGDERGMVVDVAASPEEIARQVVEELGL